MQGPAHLLQVECQNAWKPKLLCRNNIVAPNLPGRDTKTGSAGNFGKADIKTACKNCAARTEKEGWIESPCVRGLILLITLVFGLIWMGPGGEGGFLMPSDAVVDSGD